MRLETRIPTDHPLRAIRELIDEALRELSRTFNRRSPGGGFSILLYVHLGPKTLFLRRKVALGVWTRSSSRRPKTCTRSDIALTALVQPYSPLLPRPWIENRARNLAPSIPNESNPRVVALVHIEFRARLRCHGDRFSLLEVEDWPKSY
jgi:hypothetical protein